MYYASKDVQLAMIQYNRRQLFVVWNYMSNRTKGCRVKIDDYVFEFKHASKSDLRINVFREGELKLTDRIPRSINIDSLIWSLSMSGIDVSMFTIRR